MIDPKCLTSEWIKTQAYLMKCQPYMLEKAIVALQLLGNLAETGLTFQFKGGTSLLLRLPKIRRLSIDIDIATPNEDLALNAINSIQKTPPFFRCTHDEARDAALPPKKHFRFHYYSTINFKNDGILLDVLYEAKPSPDISPVTIATPFIECLRRVDVTIPSIDAMLGDKLTAFAPTTIGIPYVDKVGNDRKTDVVKQLFDTAALFDAAKDLGVIARAYESLHERQCAYKEKQYARSETLGDSIAAAMQLSAHNPKGKSTTLQGKILADGVNSLANHLVGEPFGPFEAAIAAGKVACVAAWIMGKRENPAISAIRFDQNRVLELAEKSIKAHWPQLNALKQTNPEAFHYWWHAAQLNSP